MNILTMIKTWYSLYPSTLVFLEHKLTHLTVGALISMIGVSYPIVALCVVLEVAIGKEICDQMDSPAPFYTHVLDIIVTCLGGILGFILIRLV